MPLSGITKRVDFFYEGLYTPTHISESATESRGGRKAFTETVRGALFHRGKVLLLQKDETSRIPGSFEFPGGKVDKQATHAPTLEEQIEALVSEVGQETNVDIDGLPVEKVDEFNMLCEDKTGSSTEVRRSKVPLFLVRMPDADELSVVVNQTKNAEGEPEDKHGGHAWVTPAELKALAVSFVHNPHTKKIARPLARNSRRVRKLLDALEGPVVRD